MRVALYGGSFNPPTLAHRAVVCQILATCLDVDRVWITPAYKHAYGKHMADYHVRMQLCENLFQSIPHTHVSLLESVLDSTTGSTYELLKYAVRTPDVDSIRLVVGQDQAEQIAEHWINGQRLLDEFSLIIVPRGDLGSVDLPWTKYHMVLPPLPKEFREISSTQARECFAKDNQEDLPKFLAPETIKFCNKLGLYR